MTKSNIPKPVRICQVEGCEAPVIRYTALGICGKHYQRMVKHPDIDLDSSRSIYDPNEFIIEDDVARIVLYDAKGNKCGEAIIDKEDLHLVKGYKWRMIKKVNSNYCTTGIDSLPLQQVVMFVNSKIDHIDRDGLNNRRCNLRKCTHQQNSFNQGPSRNNTSGVKGVYWDKAKLAWIPKIQKDNKHYIIGSFNNIKEATIAYNKVAQKMHGEFAYLNPIEEQLNG